MTSVLLQGTSMHLLQDVGMKEGTLCMCVERDRYGERGKERVSLQERRRGGVIRRKPGGPTFATPMIAEVASIIDA